MSATLRGISWLKRKIGWAFDPVEAITVEASMEKLISILPGWIIQSISNNRCLVVKEFYTKEQGKALVALLPTRALVFRNLDGSFMDAETFPIYLLQDKVPQTETIVYYCNENSCYTWLCDQAPLFEPEIMTEITDAMSTLVAHT
ncbi:MAG: hypothetical protein ACM3UW_02640 [Bacillota bacterium]